MSEGDGRPQSAGPATSLRARRTPASTTLTLQWTPAKRQRAAGKPAPPNLGHAEAHHTPETERRAARDQGALEGETAFQESPGQARGLRNEVQEQRGSGWLECLKVERGELGIRSKTNKTDSKV